MNRTVFISIASVLALGLVVGACAKRPAMTAATAPAPSGQAMVAAPANEPMASPPAALAPAPAPERPVAKDFAPVADLQMIHFDFDRSEIRSGDAKILDANAQWLKANAKQLVLIEGHCDERGTNEYNLVLGERRAKATMNYLASRGIAADRMSTISYGEERPLCTEHNEKCWSQNRRANFLVKEQ